MSDMNWHRHVGGAPPERRAIATSVVIGKGCLVWDFARLLAHVVIGDNVSIGGGTEIGTGSTIGDGSRIGAGCFFPSHSIIGTNVFVGPGVMCADDRHPVCGNPGYVAEPPIIEDGASVGMRATLMPGIRIGRNARVAAETLVTRDVPADTGVKGSPGRGFDLPNGWKASPLLEVLHG